MSILIPIMIKPNNFAFIFFIFTYKKEASFFTSVEELLKETDFGLTRYNKLRMCGFIFNWSREDGIYYSLLQAYIQLFTVLINYLCILDKES